MFFCLTFHGTHLFHPSLFQIRATQLVLKAHTQAVNSLSGNNSAKLGTVAAAVAAANSTALESSKEIEAAMQISMRNSLGMITNRSMDGPLDDFTIMKVLSVAKVLMNVGIFCNFSRNLHSAML